MVQLSELTLVKATPAQELDSCKRTFVQWSRGMTMEEYVERDKVMAQQEHCADGKWTTWVLVPRHDPTTLNYLCSCETFRRVGAIARPEDTQARNVVSYGVASVFTPDQNRGLGYASHMMRLLHWVLAPVDVLPPFPPAWGAPPPDGPHDGQFSVLYSDVGSKFYHNCGPTPSAGSGWETVNPISTSWKVDVDDSFTKRGVDSNEWTLLTKEDACEIWEKDSWTMKDDIASTASTTGKLALTFLPTGGVGEFSIQRTMKFTPDLKPVLDKFWGVAHSQGDRGLPSPDAYATWTYEPGTKTIVLTRLRACSNNFPSLVEKLREISKSLDKDTIEAWNVPEHLREAAESAGGVTVLREEHLSAVKWYGPEEKEQLLWLFNEKFCWC
ncbi:hypothetical protein BDY19DRAFT_1041718 [Irpex rosettiformis]|uniref:Uncharacterized protein n=1 Tax=Irpex rosettiformis TaxID=378272 RepID=A0ACB8U3F1_9APHY|nr:hypothetical protein BDY19DRAFT_1041718 [Irpex rosettiformis]